MIGEAVQTVGPAVGGKLMAGHLASEYNVTVGCMRVQRSLRRVDPGASELRRVRIDRLVRPGVYHGRFFGYNLHMDQNEKLNIDGATFVIAVDGHSSCVVGAATMVRKNNIVIYDKVFRPVCQFYGLWHRVIVDHGQEFFLTLYMQQALHYRMRYIEDDNMESTYRQMRSVKNTRVERMWVYVNRLVSYPEREQSSCSSTSSPHSTAYTGPPCGGRWRQSMYHRRSSKSSTGHTMDQPAVCGSEMNSLRNFLSKLESARETSFPPYCSTSLLMPL